MISSNFSVNKKKSHHHRHHLPSPISVTESPQQRQYHNQIPKQSVYTDFDGHYCFPLRLQFNHFVISTISSETMIFIVGLNSNNNYCKFISIYCYFLTRRPYLRFSFFLSFSTLSPSLPFSSLISYVSSLLPPSPVLFLGWLIFCPVKITKQKIILFCCLCEFVRYPILPINDNALNIKRTRYFYKYKPVTMTI